MPSQREQYGNTVHLFIGTGRSPCKITSRPFAFDNNSIVIYLGLDSLFLFKSVSSFLPSCRSFLAHSFGSVPSFVLFVFLHPSILTCPKGSCLLGPCFVAEGLIERSDPQMKLFAQDSRRCLFAELRHYKPT